MMYEWSTMKRLIYLLGNSATGGGGSGMELVKSYTYDKKLIDDGVIQSIPSYSTSFQTLEASAEIEQLTCDFSNYFYFIFARGLTIPIYNTDTKGSGREEYSLASFFGMPYTGPSNVPCISDPAKTFDQSTTGLSKSIETTCYVRWKNESEITADVSSSYGVYQSFPNIQVTGNNLVVKSPNMYIRGNSNYFSSTYWSALTDIRCQYIIDVYKMPKPTASENLYKQYEHIFDCVRTNSHTLT